jgi:multicomponent Na+:H+ antiporter subunit G
MNIIIGDVLIGIGMFFMVFGVIGLIKNKSFFTRILIAAKIDTVGTITVIMGVAVKHGLSWFSLKAVLLMGIIMVVNPLMGHIIARSSHDRDGNKGGGA